MTLSRTAPFAASAARVGEMNGPTKPPEGWSLGRWSRLKREAVREKDVPPAAPAKVAPPAIAAAPPAAIDSTPASAARAETLPPVESLTFDSDFAAFLQPKVDETLKRQALKQLFRDPRFNVMDGLDVYIDDYSKPDPIDPEVVRQMVQARYIFDPPQTRINAQGFAEDVPADELASAKAESVGGPADPSVRPGVEIAVDVAQSPADAIVAVSAEAEAQESGAEAPPSDPPDGPLPSAR